VLSAATLTALKKGRRGRDRLGLATLQLDNYTSSLCRRQTAESVRLWALPWKRSEMMRRIGSVAKQRKLTLRCDGRAVEDSTSEPGARIALAVG